VLAPVLANRLILLFQFLATLTILALVPTNLGKLAALLSLWLITFRRLSGAEFAMYCGACLFFTAMNAASLKQGIFSFSRPDFLGMPVYEFFMWGFYLLHTKRMVGGVAPQKRWDAWALAVLYALAFGAIPDPHLLLAVTATLLLIGIALFHEPLDLGYVGYMVLFGAAVEYTGVWSGQWTYPGEPLGGVPLWFITLWGGVGLFLRRIVLPIVANFEAPVRLRL
jgi:hypothetical protein